MNEIIQLPFQVQATLAAGYLGYALMKRDHRKNEKMLDVWLHILLLGLPTAVATQVWETQWAYVSVLIAPILAFVWVKWCKQRWYKLLHWSDVSYDTGETSVWNALSTRKGLGVAQITVTLKNGNKYSCNKAYDFRNKPFAPMVMDDDGIAFYVSSYIKSTDDDWSDIENVTHDTGDEVTYFPRTDIAMLEIRHRDKKK